MSKGNSIPAAILMLSCVFGPAAVAAQPIAAGDGRQTVDIAGTRLTVFTYRPANCSDPSLLMVFHGNARNARTYRDYAQALADRHCLLLVAPLFDRRDFPAWRYQRGGIVKDGVVQNPQDWTGMLVPALADWVRQQEGRPLAYSLLGHSAGSQFLERLAAFVPTQARRIVVANPGSYVSPSLEPRRMGWARSTRAPMAKRNCGAISNNRSPSILAKGIRTLTTAMTAPRPAPRAALVTSAV